MMQTKISSGATDVDIVEYSLATKMLENKLSVLQALNIQNNVQDDKLTLNIKGTNKSIEIDLVKL